MDKIGMDQVRHLSDRSRSGLMERCRRRALEMTEQAGPYEVWQHLGKDRGYRLVGTLPGLPHQSTSGIYQIRPGDYGWGEIDGQRVILAAWNICPGDFACLPGFHKPDGSTPEPSPFAATFVELSDLGLSRFETIERIVKDALDG